MKKLSYYLIQGILFVGPLAFTIYILFVMFTYIDDLLRSVMSGTIGWQIPGMGVLLMLLVLILVGFVGQTIIARPFKAILRYIIRRIPILELIYQSFDDFLNAIFGEKRKFNKPVMVRMYPDTDLEKIGFITSEDLAALGETGKVAVYFPFCYSIAGEVYIVPSDRVKVLALPTAEVMKFVVSGGVAGISTGRKGLKK